MKDPTQGGEIAYQRPTAINEMVKNTNESVIQENVITKKPN
jgi:hypothetical protein